MQVLCDIYVIISVNLSKYSRSKSLELYFYKDIKEMRLTVHTPSPNIFFHIATDKWTVRWGGGIILLHIESLLNTKQEYDGKTR